MRPPQPHRIDRVGLAAGVALPLAVASVPPLLALLWQDRLPAQIAQHWGAEGNADGFGSLWANTWLITAVAAAVGLGCGAPAAFARILVALRQLLLVAALATTGLLVALWTAALHAQLDLADATQARTTLWPAAAGALAGLLVGVAAARGLRDGRVRADATTRPPAHLPRGPLTPVALALGPSRKVWALVLAAVVPASAAVAALVGDIAPVPLFTGMAVVVLALLRYRVHADHTGLRAYWFGLTAFDIGIAEVTKAEVTHVSPVRDFGGWGLRARGKGQYGLVTRKGPGVVVTTAAGQRFTITTDRAKDIAGLLNTAADASRPG